MSLQKRSFCQSEDKQKFPPCQRGDKGGWEFVFIGAIVILSVLAIYFARSEGALIGLVAALIIFGLLIGKKMRLATIIVLLIAGVGIYFSPIQDYAVRKVTLMDFSGQVRQAQWSETWQMLKDGKIIFGAGLANYQKAIAPYHVEGIFYDDGTDPDFYRHVVWNDEYKKQVWRPVEIYLYPHNIFLNFWTELGFFGLLLFVWIIIKFSIINFSRGKLGMPTLRRHNFQFFPRQARDADFTSAQLSIKEKKYKYIYLGLLGAIIIIVVHGLVDAPYFKNDLACLFWILIALFSLLKLKKRTSS